MTIDEKKAIEDNFDRMREIISNTWLPTKNEYGDVVGETRLGTDDIFRLATALINEGFRLERTGKWIEIPDYSGNGWQIAGKPVQPKSCSACGDVYSKAYTYCPKCGAKMKEV